MLERALNLPPISTVRAAMARRRLGRCLEEEAAGEFLQLLLGAMATAILVNPKLRAHVEGFEARFAFRNSEGTVTHGARFSHGLLWVTDRPPDDPDATIIYRDGRALMRSLLAAEPDLLGALLRQDVSFEGNLNCVYRLAFLARRVQRLALPQRA